MRDPERAKGQPDRASARAAPSAPGPAAQAVACGSDYDAQIAQARQRLAEARRNRSTSEPERQPRLVGTLRLDLLLR